VTRRRLLFLALVLVPLAVVAAALVMNRDDSLLVSLEQVPASEASSEEVMFRMEKKTRRRLVLTRYYVEVADSEGWRAISTNEFPHAVDEFQNRDPSPPELRNSWTFSVPEPKANAPWRVRVEYGGLLTGWSLLRLRLQETWRCRDLRRLVWVWQTRPWEATNVVSVALRQ